MKSPYRPILHIPKTKVEKIFNAIGGGIFLLSLIYATLNWTTLPDQIPGHFNGLGEVERWGSKFEIFILPVIGFFVASLLTLLEKAPHMHNYPKRLNESNVEQFYINSRIILNLTKNICLVIFSILIIQIIRVAKGESESLGAWFLPVLITMVFIPIIIGIYKSSKIK